MDAFKYVKEGGCDDPDINWDLKCKMERRLMNCFYFVTCYNLAPRRLKFNCTYVHKSSKVLPVAITYALKLRELKLRATNMPSCGTSFKLWQVKCDLNRNINE